MVGGGQVLPACNHAMVLKQDCIVFRYKRFKAFAEFPSSRRPVGCQRNVAKIRDDFRKDGLFHRAASGGKPRCGWWVGMTYSMHLRSQAVKKNVHQDFR